MVELTLEKLQKATTPKDVFGELIGNQDEQYAALKSIFRQLAKATHEDLFPSKDKADARLAFQILNNWHELALSQIKNGNYGEDKPITITFRKFTYILNKKLKDGDLSEIYLCNEPKKSNTKILKLAADPSINPMLKNEAKNLLKISQYDGPQKALIINHVQKFENSFEISGRQGNFLELNENFVSLEDVLKPFHEGVEPRAMAWIFRRMLASLIGIHDAGIIHGAVTPAHFMISPADHNGRLIDFCYSVPIGEKVTAICPKYKNLYAPEILNKNIVGPETDIYMAAKTIQLLMGEVVYPKEIQNFIKSLLINNRNHRPKNTLDIFTEFSNILNMVFGTPKFVEFKMPK